MAGDGQVVGLTPEGARRVRRATSYVELSARGNGAGRGRWGGPRPRQGGRYAKVTTAITARSGSTLGSGIITLYNRSGATLSLSTDADDVGLTVYNSVASTIAVNSIVQVKWCDGAWAVDVGGC